MISEEGSEKEEKVGGSSSTMSKDEENVDE